MNKEPIPRVCYVLLCAVADALDTALSFVSPIVRPQASPSDIEHLTDREVLDLRQPENNIQASPDGPVIHRVTPNTVLKRSQDYDEDVPEACEANALNIVYANTTVPVPRVRRVLTDSWSHVIAIEYIDGCMLSELWPTYSLWKKIHVAFTLRRYFRQIRRFCKAPSDAPPGPVVTGGNAARTCDVPSIFGAIKSIRGPFPSYSELRAWFNMKRDTVVSEDDPYRRESFDDSEPLVLSHLDLNLRNVMVDKDGRLWIIDWSWSGYYPPWFEYMATLMQSQLEVACGTSDYTWKLLIPFICGPYFKQRRWMWKMMPSLDVS